VFVVFFITTIEIPAPIMLVYWFVTQLFSGFGSIAQTHISQGGTAFFAHIGGFVAGIVLVKLMGATGQYNRRRDRYWE
jgi:membrane associated rhomboid family serine protease